ncbi:unnamed protein product, partial [Prunus brigantina]
MVGEGSSGSVFLTTPKNPRRGEFGSMLNFPGLMAVKSAEVSDSESIRHEAEVLLDIKGCPFIIERFGEEITTSEEGGDHMVYNLLLEFASGGTLGDLIEKSNGHGLPEAEVRRYTRSILEGIKHIHKFDYVHCDLKPENILLVPNPATSTGSFVVKISDFGLDKKTKENYGQWRGTPTYLSPEALNDSEQEPPSDIWSLGCIVLEMLTGKSFSDLKPGCELEVFHSMLAAEKLLLHPFVVGQSHRKQLVIQRGRWFAHLQAMQMAPNQAQIVTQALPLFAEFCHHPVLRYLLLL